MESSRLVFGVQGSMPLSQHKPTKVPLRRRLEMEHNDELAKSISRLHVFTDIECIYLPSISIFGFDHALR